MIVPIPRECQAHDGAFTVPAAVTVVVSGADFAVLNPVVDRLLGDFAEHGVTATMIGHAPVAVVIERRSGAYGCDGYVLEVTAAGVVIHAAESGGLRCGIQALRQLVRIHGTTLPLLTIRDHADFAVRGFYHDCTRGRVPKLETLLALIEDLALLRYNHLQLYIEHTFQFEGFSDLWAGADPLTADDILAIQDRCAELGIELVPSLSCFGHSYTMLRSYRRQHLNELDVDAMAQPFSLYDRLLHYTFDPVNPESLATVRSLLEQYVPLHHSEWVNICCDETVDLGRGRNRELAERVGVGRLYIDFVKQLCEIVQGLGKKPMLWGDILLEHPEYIAELPTEVCVLHWDYDAELQRPIAPVRDSGQAWLGCPGIHTWKTFGCQIDRADANLRAMADLVRDHHGSGMLVTDWGDLGHASVLAATRYGMAHGAQVTWCAAAGDRTAVDAAWGQLAYGDSDGAIGAALMTIAEAEEVWWYHIARDVDPSTTDSDRDAETGVSIHLTERDPARIAAAIPILQAARKQLVAAQAPHAQGQADLKELKVAAWASELMHEAVLVILAGADRSGVLDHGRDGWAIADELRLCEQAFSTCWHARHRPSEYHRLQVIWLQLADRLDALTTTS